VYRRKPSGEEIFFIKDPFNRWTFPKGHTEPGEALHEAAIRECFEEAGLKDLKLIAPLGRTSFRFRRDGTVIQKVVHFFLLEAPPHIKEHFVTRAELPPGKEPIFEGKWVRLNQAFAVSSYTNSDRLLVKALRIISRRKQQHRQ
jgi:8-oxo-dGTP pyrophosphatase MutT (NUDIX family)